MSDKNAMKEGDLLYHAAHGLCCVQKITKKNESGKPVTRYAIVPKMFNQMKVRFLVAGHDMEVSGFHPLLSQKEANEILAYLKVGDGVAKSSKEEQIQAILDYKQDSGPWASARALLFFSHEKADIREQRKRQMLDRAAKGLVRELALALGVSIKESAVKLQKSLESTLKVHPSVLTAFAQAVEE